LPASRGSTFPFGGHPPSPEDVTVLRLAVVPRRILTGQMRGGLAWRRSTFP
jgi:hypothetical protein